jgi:hypothetical protein
MFFGGATTASLDLEHHLVVDDYFAYALRFEAGPVWLLALRDAVLLALLATAAVPLRGPRADYQGATAHMRRSLV